MATDGEYKALRVSHGLDKRFYFGGSVFPVQTTTQDVDGEEKSSTINHLTKRITRIVLAPVPQDRITTRDGRKVVHWRLHLCTGDESDGSSMIIDTMKDGKDKKNRMAFISVQFKTYAGSWKVDLEDNLEIALEPDLDTELTTEVVLNWIQAQNYHVYEMNEHRSGCLAWCCAILRAMYDEGWIHGRRRNLVNRMAAAIKRMRDQEDLYDVPKDEGIFTERGEGGEKAKQVE